MNECVALEILDMLQTNEIQVIFHRIVFLPAYMLVTALSDVVAFGYQAQAAYDLGPTLANYRNATLVLQIIITIYLTGRIQNFVKWLGIANAMLALSLFINPIQNSLVCYTISSVAAGLCVGLTWKICARTFHDSIQGMGFQNLVCLAGGALGVALAPHLAGCGHSLVYAVLASLAVPVCMWLSQPFTTFISALMSINDETDEESLGESGTLNRRDASVLGLCFLYGLFTACKSSADIPLFELVKIGQLPNWLMPIEAGASIVMCLFFTARPDLFRRLERLGYGRLFLTCSLFATLGYVILGAKAPIFVVFMTRVIMGVLFEVFERGSEDFEDRMLQGRRRELQAGQFFVLSFRPLQFAGNLITAKLVGATALYALAGYACAMSLAILVFSVPLGRALIRLAGPRE